MTSKMLSSNIPPATWTCWDESKASNKGKAKLMFFTCIHLLMQISIYDKSADRHLYALIFIFEKMCGFLLSIFMNYF